MNIILSTGSGTGPTARAAYDAALISAGVTHYNMICLTSVIPPHSHIYRDNARSSAPSLPASPDLHHRRLECPDRACLFR